MQCSVYSFTTLELSDGKDFVSEKSHIQTTCDSFKNILWLEGKPEGSF
jgi:hypothetical protein